MSVALGITTYSSSGSSVCVGSVMARDGPGNWSFCTTVGLGFLLSAKSMSLLSDSSEVELESDGAMLWAMAGLTLLVDAALLFCKSKVTTLDLRGMRKVRIVFAVTVVLVINSSLDLFRLPVCVSLVGLKDISDKVVSTLVLLAGR